MNIYFGEGEFWPGSMSGVHCRYQPPLGTLLVKIGFAQTVNRRISQLQSDKIRALCPRLTVVFVWRLDLLSRYATYDVEQRLHRYFHEFRVHGTEFFLAQPIRNYLKLGLVSNDSVATLLHETVLRTPRGSYQWGYGIAEPTWVDCKNTMEQRRQQLVRKYGLEFLAH